MSGRNRQALLCHRRRDCSQALTARRSAPDLRNKPLAVGALFEKTVRVDVETERNLPAEVSPSPLPVLVRRAHSLADPVAFILVNNVGGSARGGSIDPDEATWARQMGFNLRNLWLTCRAVLPHMAERGSGAIVNAASTSGIRHTGSLRAACAAAKAAIIQFSRVVAVEFAPKGVRVNTVVFGQLHASMVETRLALQRAGGDRADQTGTRAPS